MLVLRLRTIYIYGRPSLRYTYAEPCLRRMYADYVCATYILATLTLRVYKLPLTCVYYAALIHMLPQACAANAHLLSLHIIHTLPPCWLLNWGHVAPLLVTGLDHVVVEIITVTLVLSLETIAAQPRMLRQQCCTTT